MGHLQRFTERQVAYAVAEILPWVRLCNADKPREQSPWQSRHVAVEQAVRALTEAERRLAKIGAVERQADPSMAFVAWEQIEIEVTLADDALRALRHEWSQPMDAARYETHADRRFMRRWRSGLDEHLDAFGRMT